jgi:hypothetical protein
MTPRRLCKIAPNEPKPPLQKLRQFVKMAPKKKCYTVMVGGVTMGMIDTITLLNCYYWSVPNV